jgi:hypothetical protein
MQADHEIIGNLYRQIGVKVEWRAGPCDEEEVPVDGHTAYAADGTTCRDNSFRASAASALSRLRSSDRSPGCVLSLLRSEAAARIDCTGLRAASIPEPHPGMRAEAHQFPAALAGCLGMAMGIAAPRRDRFTSGPAECRALPRGDKTGGRPK